jgi:hypothetical protein
VWRFRTRSCTTGFGDGAIGRRCHGRWRRKRRRGKKGAMGSLAGGEAKARGRDAAGAGETGVGKARVAYITAVCVSVLSVRRGRDAGAAVVGLGEAGAGGGDSSGA